MQSDDAIMTPRIVKQFPGVTEKGFDMFWDYLRHLPQLIDLLIRQGYGQQLFLLALTSVLAALMTFRVVMGWGRKPIEPVWAQLDRAPDDPS